MTACNAVLRRANAGDLEALSALKSDYIRSRYRGFLPREALERASPGYYREEISGFLSNPENETLILERCGRIEGYILFGPGDEPGAAIILDARSDEGFSAESHHALLNGAVRRLGAKGFTSVQVWLLRNNYRARYLFESFGFRPDGALRQEAHIGRMFNMTRYVCRIPPRP